MKLMNCSEVLVEQFSILGNVFLLLDLQSVSFYSVFIQEL